MLLWFGKKFFMDWLDLEKGDPGAGVVADWTLSKSC
jgi:hypothetical protein